jgi:hydrogenase expression/formation protein HypD
MTFLNTFRDRKLVDGLKNRIEIVNDRGKEYIFMEVCGTHTMSIFKYGLRSLLPGNIHLLSGPGCPVCVTSTEYLDRALEIAKLPETIVTTFGDMLKVPGSKTSLYKLRAEGRDIRIVYSPSDAVKIAREAKEKKVVFLGVGFETTAPTTAAAIKMAKQFGLENFYMLSGHKIMPPAMRALVSSGEIKIDGFICPPHVSAITGTDMYNFLADEYNRSCVIAGFEPTDILQGVLMLVMQVNEAVSRVENQYSRVVTQEGNRKAIALMEEVYEKADSDWRGLGTIEKSGLKVRERFTSYDAEREFDIEVEKSEDNPACLCGDVLGGRSEPTDCTLFGEACTPSNPKGACMVSSEGACAAYYRYRRK